MPAKRTCIVVADSNGARLFLQPRPGASLEAAQPPTMAPEPASEYADRPGRVHERQGAARHGMQPHTDAKEVQRDAFARAIADALNLAVHRNEFEALILVAPPAFLGVLRGHLAADVAGIVQGELDKNLTDAPEHELPKRLGELLHFAP